MHLSIDELRHFPRGYHCTVRIPKAFLTLQNIYSHGVSYTLQPGFFFFFFFFGSLYVYGALGWGSHDPFDIGSATATN